MIIRVMRYAHGKESTGGLLFVNGKHFGYTCEDQAQPGEKVMHETRIPPGRYELELRDAGGMNERYKAKYPFHRGMLHLRNVPNFEWIYIHIGNTDDHTSGCILVGRSASRGANGEYTIGQSVTAYEKLYKLIYAAIHSGEEVWVEVV